MLKMWSGLTKRGYMLSKVDTGALQTVLTYNKEYLDILLVSIEQGN